MTIELEIPIIGSLYIDVDDEKFGEFICRQLYTSVIKKQQNKKNDKPIRIRISNGYIKDFFIQLIQGNTVVYARKVYVKEEKLYYNNSVLYLCDEQLNIEPQNSTSKENKVLSLIKKLYSICRNNTLEKKYAVYHLKFYNEVLFPIFLSYAMYGYYLVHGSLLKRGNDCILITGLDGVGKSSLANCLQQRGWCVCSDNFVLFNGENAVPLNLAMRLEIGQPTKQKVLFSTKKMKEVVDESGKCQKVLTPKSIYVLSIAKRFNIKKVCEREVYWVNYMNNAVEVGAANSFIGPILVNNFNSSKSIENISMYGLEIPKGKIEECVEEVMKLHYTQRDGKE